MNDLFASSSFKKYTDLKRHALDEMEAGMAGEDGGVNLDGFFQEVENVNEDLKELERLHKKLQGSNDETRTAHNAKTMKALRARMDQDVEQVLRRAKAIKGKLEALERSNAGSRKLPGCGPGTSTDRTRTSVVSGLGKKLKDLMDDFQSLRAKISTEYKETVGRRYFTVTGQQADEETVEQLISTGESESFLMDLHQVFLDMAALVEAQGHQLNDIESHVAHANSFVRRGTEQLEVSKDYQKSSRKWTIFDALPVLPNLLIAESFLNVR